jgi:hypothetical protein
MWSEGKLIGLLVFHGDEVMLDARKRCVITFTLMGGLAACFSTHAHLSEGQKGSAVPEDLDRRVFLGSFDHFWLLSEAASHATLTTGSCQ